MSALFHFPFWLLFFFLLTTGLYSWYILAFFLDFIPDTTNPSKPENPITDLTIIVPFRNEENCLPVLLNALSKQRNNHFKLLLVNDHSTDRSVAVIQEALSRYSLQAEIIHPPGHGKKQALMYAANTATTEYLLLTDADCVPHIDWVDTVNSVLREQHNAHLLILPVTTIRENSLLAKIQEIDFLSMIASAIASRRNPFLCNGANLCVHRSTFLALDPFKTNLHIPTGDDMFILQAFKKNSKKSIRVVTLEKTWVKTRVKTDLKGFIEQRTRWGSKTINYSDPKALILAFTVFFQSLILWIMGIASLTSTANFTLFAIFFILKLAVDSLLLIKAARFFHKQYLIHLFLFAEIAQVIYVVPVAVLGLIRNVFLYRK